VENIANISIVIPSYNRSKILLETLDQLFNQTFRPKEVIIVDQTQYEQGDAAAESLRKLDEVGQIRWLRLHEPSIPAAMNKGLLESVAARVLFLDDDIKISSDFLEKHQQVIDQFKPLAHVGQVVQPWQKPNQVFKHPKGDQKITLNTDLEFMFNSSEPASIQNCMAGNLCVDRESALAVGGFDENFSEVAYRFESEFCKRFCKALDTRFVYSPLPVLDHLYIKSGGTRTHANYLTSSLPVHSFGDYYFALLFGEGGSKFKYIASRLFFSVGAKFYVRKPWYIPVRLAGEVRGLFKALECVKQGQRLL